MKQEPRVIRDASVETLLAEQVLDKHLLKAGDACPYSALQEALGKNPRTAPAYGYIRSARHRFERKRGCVLVVVANEGIRWRTHAEIPTAQWLADNGRVKRLGKLALRRQKTTMTAEADQELGKELVMRRNLNVAMLGMVVHATSAKAEKKLEAALAQSSKVMAAGEAIKALAGE